MRMRATGRQSLIKLEPLIHYLLTGPHLDTFLSKMSDNLYAQASCCLALLDPIESFVISNRSHQNLAKSLYKKSPLLRKGRQHVTRRALDGVAHVRFTDSLLNRLHFAQRLVLESSQQYPALDRIIPVVLHYGISFLHAPIKQGLGCLLQINSFRINLIVRYYAVIYHLIDPLFKFPIDSNTNIGGLD